MIRLMCMFIGSNLVGSQPLYMENLHSVKNP